MKKLTFLLVAVFTLMIFTSCTNTTPITSNNETITSPTTVKTKTHEEIKAECTTKFDYDKCIDDIESYEITPQYFEAEVFQASKEGLSPSLLLSYEGDETKLIFGYINIDPDEFNFKKGDLVKIYGSLLDPHRTYSYETVSGYTNTVLQFCTLVIEKIDVFGSDNIYGLNQPAPIIKDGKEIGTLVINSISLMKERNKASNKNPEQVILIDYTYINSANTPGLVIFDLDLEVTDEMGNKCEIYPNTRSKSPEVTSIGSECNAQAIFGLQSKSASVKITYGYLGLKDEPKLIFKLPIV